MRSLYESPGRKHQGYWQQYRRAQERAGPSEEARSDSRISGETSTGTLLMLKSASHVDKGLPGLPHEVRTAQHIDKSFEYHWEDTRR